jgi:hypothetical protein
MCVQSKLQELLSLSFTPSITPCENCALSAPKSTIHAPYPGPRFRSVRSSGCYRAELERATLLIDQRLRGGTECYNVQGIPKLDDANDAGTKNSSDCTLILTEGDSAKALAISGLSVVGRDRYGVFPLRGKLLNVRDATHQQIMVRAPTLSLALPPYSPKPPATTHRMPESD